MMKTIINCSPTRYLEEFKFAVETWQEEGGDFFNFREIVMDGGKSDEWHPGPALIEWETKGPDHFSTISPLTNFEAKYLHCGEPVYELLVLKTNEPF